MTQGRLFDYNAEVRREKYNVFAIDLPLASSTFLSRVPGYSQLIKTGIATGKSEAHALGRFVARHNPRHVGLIVDALRKCNGGIERSVILVPEFAGEDGCPVSNAGPYFKTFQAMALASEFAAERGGSPSDYYGKACSLLEFLG